MISRRIVRKVATLTAAVVVLTLIPTAAMANPMGRHRGHGPPDRERMHEMLVERLDLTDDQQDRFQAMMERHREEMEPAMERRRSAREALADQVHAESFDEAAIRAAAADLAVIEADLAVARAMHVREVRQILTPEQWSRFQEMKEWRRGVRDEHRHGFHGHWGRGPDFDDERD